MNDDNKLAKPAESRPTGVAHVSESASNAAYPNVDRLINLASYEKPGASSSSNAVEDPDPKEPREKSLWKILLQLRPFLPYLTRFVPMLDVVAAPLQNAGLSSDVRKTVAESVAESTAKIQSGQRELNTALNAAIRDQSLQSKRLEEEILHLREVSDVVSRAQTQLSEELKSLLHLIRIAAASGIVLAVVLIVMTAILLARVVH